jgi:hypothetical protein
LNNTVMRSAQVLALAALEAHAKDLPLTAQQRQELIEGADKLAKYADPAGTGPERAREDPSRY